MDDIEDSLRLVMKYPIQRVLLNNPIPYPGTELFDTVREKGWFLIEPEVYLNTVVESENEPVFETPELDREARIKLINRIRKVEKQVTVNAVKRMYKKYAFAGTLAANLFASDYMQRLFFKNITFRRIVESLRYKRMLSGRQTV